uniref:hypothetical protein n=1 Tax=Xanthomonas campestris pv. translucens TaxID=343 RepID=UPI001E57139D
ACEGPGGRARLQQAEQAEVRRRRWKTGSSIGAGKRGDVGVGPGGGGIYAEGVPSKWSEAQVRAWVTAARRVVFGIIARNKKSPSLWDGDLG